MITKNELATIVKLIPNREFVTDDLITTGMLGT